ALPALAVLHLGASPGQVALLAFAASAPALLVSLPAGVLIDRYPLRTVLVATDLAAAATVLTIPAAAALNVLTMPLLYVIASALGSLAVLHLAGSMAAVPLLAAYGETHRTHSQYTGVLTVAGITGSAIGTVLIAVTGPARALLADAASFLVSACCMARIRALPAPGSQRGAPKPPMLGEIRDGLRHCATDAEVLRPLLLALTATSIGVGLTGTLQAYHLLTTVGVGTTGLGAIMVAGSLGGLTGTLIAPRLVIRHGAGLVLTAGFAAHALMQIPLIIARPGPLWLAVLLAGAFGQFAGATVVGTTQRSVQQWTSPTHLRARVQQTALWLSQGSMPLAALAAGALAALTSVRTVMLTGVLIGLASGGILWCSPLRRLAARDEASAR
ncbi:MFS transporter, partial [Streptomyces sp. NPDC058417]